MFLRPLALLWILVVLTVLSSCAFFYQLGYDFDQIREARVWTYVVESVGGLFKDKAHGLPQHTRKLYGQMWQPEVSPLDLSHLEAQCYKTTFQPDVYLDCAGIFGGITTVMSQLKTCFRLAIETGFHLVMPVLSERDDLDITLLHAEQANLSDFESYKNVNKHAFGHFFDEAHLIDQLKLSCPQLTIIQRDSDKNPEIDLSHKVVVHLENAPGHSIGPYAGRTDHDWVSWYKHAVQDAISSGGQHVNATSVATASPLAFFDVTGDNLGLWNDLGLLFRTLPESRSVVDALFDRLAKEIGEDAFYYGVHFRAEEDAIVGGFDSIQVQIDRILNTITEAWAMYGHDRDADVTKVVYLACGDQDKIEEFRTRALVKGWQVVDKYRLLESLDQFGNGTTHWQETLSAMNFDQQGLVDLGMLVLSEFFVGVSNSAFSYTVAHAKSETGRYQGGALKNWQFEETRNGRTQLSTDDNDVYQCCL